MQTHNLFFTLQEQYGMKYYQMPKVFFTNEKYKKLSNDAKILYALLLDRLQLSIKNKWIDSSDSLYFVYTNQTLSEILNVSPRKITNIKKELSDFTFTFHFHALEKEMATHSSVLAWRIPGLGKPSGLPSMGSHRVIHN